MNKWLEEVEAVLERGSTFLLILLTVLNAGMECGIVRYICGTYAKHGTKACTNYAVKEQEMTEIILDYLKNMSSSLDHPNLENKIKKGSRLPQKRTSLD